MFCKKCGAENPDGSAFCLSCGAGFAPAPDVSGNDVAETALREAPSDRANY